MAVGTPIRLKRAQIAIDLEATEGSAETLTNADAAIKAENVTWTPDLPFFPRNAVSSSFSQFAGTSGGPRAAELSFDVLLAGSGTAATPPSYGPALRACSMSQAITTVVTYLPCSTVTVDGDGASATLGFHVDGLLYKLVGARGKVKLSLNAGEPAKLSFNFRGIYNEPTDTDLLSSITYESTISPALLSGACTLDEVAVKYKSCEFDLGNKLMDRASPSTASGLFSVAIVGREAVGTMDPEMLAVATYNFFSKMTTNSEGAFTITVGATSGNKFIITAPKVQYSAVAPGDRDGAQVAGLSLRLNRGTDAGDDELSIVHST